MRVRRVIQAWLLLVLGACGGTDTTPTLTITPSTGSGANGEVLVSGPTSFSAVLTDSDAAVTWSVTGGGAVSQTAGLHTTFVPPTGSGTETLQATADGLTATVSIISGPQVLTAETIPGLTSPVTVLYDAEDIPHISCAQANDCFAVQGYIQARDRFFPMDFLRHVARSNLAELIGVAGLSQDIQIRTLFVTRAGHRLEDDLVAAMDTTTAATLNMYVAGINAWLAQQRASAGTTPMGGEYAQLPFPITPMDVTDWTPQDTLALARLQQFQLSETLGEETDYGTMAATWGPGGPLEDLGKLNAFIRAAAPPTEQAHTLAPTAFQMREVAPSAGTPPAPMTAWSQQLQQAHQNFVSLRNKLRPLGTAVGSNNWVVAGAKSKTQVAMVANDPHLGLQYPPLFHLSVMTSANGNDNLNLAGGSFPGIPGALVGRGAHVGWGVTVVGYDVTDLYLETLTFTGCPTAALEIPCFVFNGQPVVPVVVPQTWTIRTGPGPSGLVDVSTLNLPAADQPPAAVLINPKHGPVVSLDVAGGTAVTVRWTGQEGNTQDLKGIYGLNTATNVDTAMAALHFFSTGAQNFVLADDVGNIAYDPHALVPVRNFADIRVVGANVAPPWFPLSGSGGFEWGDGADGGGSAADNCSSGSGVPAGCWLPDAQLPQGKNPAKGYYFTANADPTSPSVSDGNSPLTHPPYLSFDWDDSSGFRATRIDQLLSAAIAANGSVALSDMEAIQSDHYSRYGKVFVDYIDTLPPSTDMSVTMARATLDAWATAGFDCPSGLTGSSPTESPVDPTPATVTNSSGCFLFHAFERDLLTNVFADDLAIIGDNVDGDMVNAIKGMIYMLSLPDNDPGANFCNDFGGQAHACSEQVVTALGQAFDELTTSVGANPSDWVWGRVHTLTTEPLLALITTNYQPGPFARPGGAFTIDVGTPSAQTSSGLSFPYASGGNVRHISLMDTMNPVVKMQLPGPERDGPYLEIGPNLLGQWVANQYFDFAYGTQINSVSVSSQTFTAQ